MDEPVGRREYQSDQNAVWKEVGRLRGILEGPPHPGLETQVIAFLTKFTTLETERERQHKANRNRLNAIIALIAALAGYMVLLHH